MNYTNIKSRKKSFSWSMTVLTINIIAAGLIVAGILYYYNIIPNMKYSNDDFDIPTYISSVDKDRDGIDDQTDILNGVMEYISTRPKYKSKYYACGYPDDGYGVCTDVVAFGLKSAGYDLMELVNAHVIKNRDLYNIEVVDKNIDFRRVNNLDKYFSENAISLTTDVSEIQQWQGGDIVVFKGHIGIVSNKRNRNGVPFVIHHARPFQLNYEEDILEKRDDLISHYRIS